MATFFATTLFLAVCQFVAAMKYDHVYLSGKYEPGVSSAATAGASVYEPITFTGTTAGIVATKTTFNQKKEVKVCQGLGTSCKILTVNSADLAAISTTKTTSPNANDAALTVTCTLEDVSKPQAAAGVLFNTA